MRRAARFLVRTVAFGVLKVFRRAESFLQPLVYATFTPKELDARSIAEWEAFGQSGPVTGEALLAWEKDLIVRQIKPQDSILVVGAGNGRDVLPLLEHGHSVTALDMTPAALGTLEAKAKTRGKAVRTICASITEADLPPGAFDVVMFSWFTIGYLRGAAARALALAKSRDALADDGRILISYIADASDDRVTRVSPLASFTARALQGVVAEPGDHINVSGELTSPSVFMSHTFNPSDIEEETKSLGFRVIEHSHPTVGVGILVLRPGDPS